MLAALLVRTPHLVRVDELFEILWPSRPPRNAMASVHNAVSALRRVLDREMIERVGDGYRLHLGPMGLDVRELTDVVERATSTDTVDEAALRSARALYQGVPYLELLDWPTARPEISRIEELQRVLGDLLATSLATAGSRPAAIADLMGLTDEDPTREQRWAALATALVSVGRPSDAHAAIDRADAAFADAGLPAPTRLRRLVDRLAAAVGPAPAPRSTSPLSGRDALVQRLQRRAGALVVGVPGIGKTRLIAEATSHLDERCVIPVRCLDDDDRWAPLAGRRGLGRPLGGPPPTDGHRCTVLARFEKCRSRRPSR